MLYQYLAYNEGGQIVKGKLSAASEEAATELLGYAGYRAVNLKLSTPFLDVDKLTAGFFHVKPNEIILFYRQMAMLLESGIDIIAALELLRLQAANRALKKVLIEVIADLRSGSQLSAASGGQIVFVNVIDPLGELLGLPVAPGPVATFDLPIPPDPSLAGIELFTQAAHVGGVQPFELSNSQDLFIGE